MFICRNAEGVHGQRKFGNLCNNLIAKKKTSSYQHIIAEIANALTINPLLDHLPVEWRNDYLYIQHNETGKSRSCISLKKVG